MTTSSRSESIPVPDITFDVEIVKDGSCVKCLTPARPDTPMFRTVSACICGHEQMGTFTEIHLTDEQRLIINKWLGDRGASICWLSEQGGKAIRVSMCGGQFFCFDCLMQTEDIIESNVKAAFGKE